MMLHVPIRSRSANLLLALAGVIFTITAPVVLAWYVMDVWSSATSTDRALQFMLFLVTALGLLLLFIGLQNLGFVRGGLPQFRRHLSGEHGHLAATMSGSEIPRRSDR
jgi:hypothetical protein